MRKLALFLFVLLAASGVEAGPGGCTNFPVLVPFASEAITVSSTSKALTAATFGATADRPADMAICNVETDAVRYRADGVDPTASVGHYVQAGTSTSPSVVTVCGLGSLRKVRFIRVTTDAALFCTYYRGE